MSTFLELCQDVSRESGTSGGGTLLSVTGQNGRLAKYVAWVRQAWVDIQNERRDWMWMRREFAGQTTAGAGRYTAASWAIARWGRWCIDDPKVDYLPTTIQKAALTRADEGAIRVIDFNRWRTTYDRGLQTPNRPTEYAISPVGEFCLGSIPDATYIVRGEYVLKPQVLAANTDVPELPSEFHNVIVWRALMLLDTHDESQVRLPEFKLNHRAVMGALCRAQLPSMSVEGSEPIA